MGGCIELGATSLVKWGQTGGLEGCMTESFVVRVDDVMCVVLVPAFEMFVEACGIAVVRLIGNGCFGSQG